jgi:DHA1 family bicyclomycin/chloramphenicol resistance-like MFS transporter
VANLGGSARRSATVQGSAGLALLIAGLSMVGPFTIDTMFPAFPDMQREFGVDAVAMQQTISVYLLAFAAMSLFHGPISDAVGRKPVIVLGSVCYTLTSVVCAAAPTMGWLLTGRVLQGLCAGAGMIVGRTVIRDVFEGHAAQRTMSHVAMIFGVAPALAPIVGGWLLGWYEWRSIFWFLAAFGFVMLVLSAVFLPESHPPELRTPFRPLALVSAVWSTALDPNIARLCAVSSFNFAALFMYISGAPIIVVTHLGLGEGDFGLLFVPIVTAMIFGSFLTGRLAGRIRSRTFVATGLTSAALGGLLQVLVLTLGNGPKLPWVLVGPVLTAFGIALVFPIVSLVLLDQRPANRGSASSLQSLSNTLLNAVVAGAIVPLVSWSMTAMALTATGFTVTAWAFWVWQRRRSPGPLVQPQDVQTLEPTDRM